MMIKVMKKDKLIRLRVIEKKMKAQVAKRRSRLFANMTCVLKEKKKETACGERKAIEKKKKE